MWPCGIWQKGMAYTSFVFYVGWSYDQIHPKYFMSSSLKFPKTTNKLDRVYLKTCLNEFSPTYYIIIYVKSFKYIKSHNSLNYLNKSHDPLNKLYNQVYMIVL